MYEGVKNLQSFARQTRRIKRHLHHRKNFIYCLDIILIGAKFTYPANFVLFRFYKADHISLQGKSYIFFSSVTFAEIELVVKFIIAFNL